MALTRIGPNQSVNLASNVTGTLPAANGGSGRTAVTGNVLQVVSNTYASDISTSSTSLVATGYTSTLTPSATSSKILILVNGGKIDWDGGTINMEINLYGKIGSNSYADISGNIEDFRFDQVYTNSHSISFLWSPSTTSEVIVQPYFKATSGTVYFNRSSTKTSITTMEIAG